MAVGAKRVAELAKSLRSVGADVYILTRQPDANTDSDPALLAHLTGITRSTAWTGFTPVDTLYRWAKKLWRIVLITGASQETQTQNTSPQEPETNARADEPNRHIVDESYPCPNVELDDVG